MAPQLSIIMGRGILQQVTVLGPKSALPLLVALILAKLHCLAVLHSPDVYFRKRCGDSVSLCIDSDQRDDEIVFSQHIVHINAESTSGELHRALEEASDLVMASIVT